MKAFELRFVTVSSADDPLWDFVERVFVEAFPPDERREFHLQRKLAAHEPRFTQCVVFDEQRPVAILSYWMLECGNYFEHIATAAEARGGGLGAAIIEHLLKTVSPSWFGEVELPGDELCRRRIAFYERLGFVGYPSLAYVQPAYGNGKSPIPMMIMSVGDLRIDEPTLAQIVNEMSGTVYSNW